MHQKELFIIHPYTHQKELFIIHHGAWVYRVFHLALRCACASACMRACVHAGVHVCGWVHG